MPLLTDPTTTRSLFDLVRFAHLLSGCFTLNPLVRTRPDVVSGFNKYRWATIIWLAPSLSAILHKQRIAAYRWEHSLKTNWLLVLLWAVRIAN